MHVVVSRTRTGPRSRDPGNMIHALEHFLAGVVGGWALPAKMICTGRHGSTSSRRRRRGRGRSGWRACRCEPSGEADRERGRIQQRARAHHLARLFIWVAKPAAGLLRTKLAKDLLEPDVGLRTSDGSSVSTWSKAPGRRGGCPSRGQGSSSSPITGLAIQVARWTPLVTWPIGTVSHGARPEVATDVAGTCRAAGKRRSRRQRAHGGHRHWNCWAGRGARRAGRKHRDRCCPSPATTGPPRSRAARRERVVPRRDGGMGVKTLCARTRWTASGSSGPASCTPEPLTIMNDTRAPRWPFHTAGSMPGRGSTRTRRAQYPSWRSRMSGRRRRAVLRARSSGWLTSAWWSSR